MVQQPFEGIKKKNHKIKLIIISFPDISLQTRKQKPTRSKAREGKLFDSGNKSDSDPYDSDADPVFVEPLEISEEESSDESKCSDGIAPITHQFPLQLMFTCTEAIYIHKSTKRHRFVRK